MSENRLLLDIDDESKSLEYYEFGLPFDYKAARFRLFRDPVIQFLCKGLPEEALIKGFDIIHKEGEEKGQKHDSSDDITSVIQQYSNEIINAISYDRAFGHGLITLMGTKKNGEKENKFFIKSLMPESYAYGYDEKTGLYKDANADFKWVKLENKSSKVEEQKENKTFDDKTSIHVMTNQTDVIGVGKPYIESIFDDAFGFYVTAESATYFVVKNGPGLKLYYITDTDWNNDERMSEIDEDIKKNNAPKSSMKIKLPSDPDAPKPTVEEISSPQIDFPSIADIYYGRIAMRSKVPMSRLKGLEPGQLAAGEINQASYFDVLEEIQMRYTAMYLKLIELISIQLGKEIDISTIELEYKVRQSLSETEQADLLGKQIENLEKLIVIEEKAGIPFKTIQEWSGLEWVIDEAMRTKAKEAAAMTDALKNGNMDGDKETTEDDNTNEDDNTIES